MGGTTAYSKERWGKCKVSFNDSYNAVVYFHNDYDYVACNDKYGDVNDSNLFFHITGNKKENGGTNDDWKAE